MEELTGTAMDQLTTRELRIANLVTRSWSNRKIALELGVSEQSIKNHLHRVFDKLGVWSRLELALFVTRATYQAPVVVHSTPSSSSSSSSSSTTSHPEHGHSSPRADSLA